MSDRLIGVVPEVYVTRDREFTIAFGIYLDEHLGVIPFAGATRRNPHDHENKQRGEKLAVGNAFRHLGRQILKDEYAAIHKQYNSKPKKKKKELTDECCSDGTCLCAPESSEYTDGYTDGYHQAYEDIMQEKY